MQTRAIFFIISADAANINNSTTLTNTNTLKLIFIYLYFMNTLVILESFIFLFILVIVKVKLLVYISYSCFINTFLDTQFVSCWLAFLFVCLFSYCIFLKIVPKVLMKDREKFTFSIIYFKQSNIGNSFLFFISSVHCRLNQRNFIPPFHLRRTEL